LIKIVDGIYCVVFNCIGLFFVFLLTSVQIMAWISSRSWYFHRTRNN